MRCSNPCLWSGSMLECLKASEMEISVALLAHMAQKILLFSRASRMLRSATQVVRMPFVCHMYVCTCMYVCVWKFFFPTNPYLQPGLTDLDEIWHDGMS